MCIQVHMHTYALQTDRQTHTCIHMYACIHMQTHSPTHTHTCIKCTSLLMNGLLNWCKWNKPMNIWLVKHIFVITFLMINIFLVNFRNFFQNSCLYVTTGITVYVSTEFIALRRLFGALK